MNFLAFFKLMSSCYGVDSVGVILGVREGVTVSVGVLVGSSVLVGASVGDKVCVFVGVISGVFELPFVGVYVAIGVLVATFGTHNFCPLTITVELPMQLAVFKEVTEVRNFRLIR